MGRFSNKSVLVTAGGSGIGEATCEAFVREGARLMIADINAESGGAVAARLRAAGGDVHFVRADVTSEEEVERLVSDTVSRLGGLQIAANVVGLAHAESIGPMIHESTAYGWDQTIAGTLRSVFLCSKHEIAHMIGHGGGAIVNVSSCAGFRYIPESGAAYASAKAAVAHFSKFAALSYAQYGIRVNSLAPGVTVTGAFPYHAEATYPELSPEDALKKYIDVVTARHAIKRGVKPGEQANAILWLCSDEAEMVTGHIMSVDGGLAAG